MIAGVILAAGQSKRMGKPKMNLPWGSTTVLGTVINTLLAGGLSDIVVVTGSVPVLGLTGDQISSTRFVHNPYSLESGMLVSLQQGLKAMHAETSAAMVALGDQPQIETSVVKDLIQCYEKDPTPLLVPSFNMKRGHPWLIGRALWNPLQSLNSNQTIRDFFKRYEDEIRYLIVGTATILLDLDTPEDYSKYLPKN